LLGSCNINGGRLLHLMSGNLSHQIEHHLFPDLPSNRYAEIAPRIRALCERFGLPYTSGSLTRQTRSVWKRIVRLALPGPPTTPAGGGRTTGQKAPGRGQGSAGGWQAVVTR
jgi:NADPH-dependent stearoyl-CoA 9-desaturase